MEIKPDSSLAAVLAFTAPALMLLWVAVPTRFANLHGRRVAGLAAIASLGVFAACVGAAGTVAIAGGGSVRLLEVGAVSLSLYMDALTAVMLLLVGFLGAVVTRYARNYLDGDPQQGRFTRWLCITIGCVFTLLLSGNLLMFTLAWMGTSLSLHKLLVFYSNRPAAQLAARKKFIISRLGDLCLVAALAVSWSTFGTWDFSEMFAIADRLRIYPASAPAGIPLLSLLLITGALLKSAQFPFHSWLPDTMETPTPVSALMHAGIINAGGFLVIRLSPIISLSPAALNALSIVGAITALFASVVMLTQTNIKRSLAYSTVAQMGFMMLQCGLGAFALAVLHIVAHSLYKAHAFLSSGSIVSLSRSAWKPSGSPAAHPLVLLSAAVVAAAITFATAALFGIPLTAEPGVLILGMIFLMGLAGLLWNLWSASARPGLALIGLGIVSAASLAYFALHSGAKWILASALPTYAPERLHLELLIMSIVVLLFAGIQVFQVQMPRWSQTKFGRILYVHAQNGFYLGTIANRLTEALLPMRREPVRSLAQ